MTITDWAQVVGTLAQVIFIPLLVWLGRALLKLHIDVRMLVEKVEDMEEKLKIVFDLERRVLKVEYELVRVSDRMAN